MYFQKLKGKENITSTLPIIVDGQSEVTFYVRRKFLERIDLLHPFRRY